MGNTRKRKSFDSDEEYHPVPFCPGLFESGREEVSVPEEIFIAVNTCEDLSNNELQHFIDQHETSDQGVYESLSEDTVYSCIDSNVHCSREYEGPPSVERAKSRTKSRTIMLSETYRLFSDIKLSMKLLFTSDFRGAFRH